MASTPGIRLEKLALGNAHLGTLGRVQRSALGINDFVSFGSFEVALDVLILAGLLYVNLVKVNLVIISFIIQINK